MRSIIKRLGTPQTILVLPIFMLSAAGCAAIALRSTPSLWEHMNRAIFEECDPELARGALPAQLKLLEGLLGEAPGYDRLLDTLCMGFAGYAMLFVEDEEPARAAPLYARASRYGFKGLGFEVSLPETPPPPLERVLPRNPSNAERRDESLFWATLAWFSWLNLNRDLPDALVQLPVAQDYLAHFLDRNPGLFHGTPYLLAAMQEAAKPPLLGGNLDHAAAFFEKGMAVRNGRFFLAPYLYAREYAVKTQNRDLFTQLLEGIIQDDPGVLEDVCLINAVVQEKARTLLSRRQELFF